MSPNDKFIFERKSCSFVFHLGINKCIFLPRQELISALLYQTSTTWKKCKSRTINTSTLETEDLEKRKLSDNNEICYELKGKEN